MTTVVHVRERKHNRYIGRGRDPYSDSRYRHDQDYGNPFSHTSRMHGCIMVPDRAAAIAMHLAWLRGEVEAPGWWRPTLGQIRIDLKDKILGCWCKPLSCHGDTLAALADGLLEL